MDSELASLLERIKGHVMSPEERQARRESWIRSMTLIDEDSDEARKRVATYWAGHDPSSPYAWRGEGDPPRRWTAAGGIVYRTDADCYDD